MPREAIYGQALTNWQYDKTTTMKIVLNNLFAQHQVQGEIHQGQMVPSFENPSRLQHIVKCFEDNGQADFTKPKDFGLGPITKIHDNDYIQFLSSIWQDWQAAGNESDIIPYIWPAPGLTKINHNNLNAKVGSFAFSSDTAIMKDTWQTAYQGAQTALSALHIVLAGQRSAFALTRPPGHHAHAGLYGGYCYLNNAAIAAQAALDNGYNKVCVLDVDFHHGNGTQDIFYRRSDVLTVSIHGNPKDNFPYYLGFCDEIGEGQGEGYNLNIPLNDGSDFTQWTDAFNQAAKRINEFGADMLVIPLGVDTYEQDPISSFKLTTEDFSTLGAMIEALKLPTVFVMEGGYDIAPLGQNVFNVISGFEQQQ